MPTTENRYVAHQPNRSVTRRNEPDKCEICRTEVYDPLDTVCNHLFCRRCLANYKQCPIDGTSLHQASPASPRPQHWVPVQAASSSRNFNSAQTEITTVTKTTHTTTSETLPCAFQPIQQLRDERWSEQASGSARQSMLEDRSQTVQRTWTQPQTPQQASEPMKETKAEIYIDAERMIQIMCIEVDFVLYHREYFNDYVDVMRNVCRAWQAELWKRDGLSMLWSNFLNMLESEVYAVFDGRDSRVTRPDMGEMPVGLKHGFHRVAVSIAKMYPECRRVRVENSVVG